MRLNSNYMYSYAYIGRMVETRCLSGGIDHGFISWLVYGNKLASLLKIKIYPQGEGAVNTLGGICIYICICSH